MIVDATKGVLFKEIAALICGYDASFIQRWVARDLTSQPWFRDHIAKSPTAYLNLPRIDPSKAEASKMLDRKAVKQYGGQLTDDMIDCHGQTHTAMLSDDGQSLSIRGVQEVSNIRILRTRTVVFLRDKDPQKDPLTYSVCVTHEDSEPWRTKFSVWGDTYTAEALPTYLSHGFPLTSVFYSTSSVVYRTSVEHRRRGQLIVPSEPSAIAANPKKPPYC